MTTEVSLRIENNLESVANVVIDGKIAFPLLPDDTFFQKLIVSKIFDVEVKSISGGKTYYTKESIDTANGTVITIVIANLDSDGTVNLEVSQSPGGVVPPITPPIVIIRPLFPGCPTVIPISKKVIIILLAPTKKC